MIYVNQDAPRYLVAEQSPHVPQKHVLSYNVLHTDCLSHITCLRLTGSYVTCIALIGCPAMCYTLMGCHVTSRHVLQACYTLIGWQRHMLHADWLPASHSTRWLAVVTGACCSLSAGMTSRWSDCSCPTCAACWRHWPELGEAVRSSARFWWGWLLQRAKQTHIRREFYYN